MRAQLRKPGACGVLSLEVKYDPAFRLKCTGTLIIDDIQHSRKSCHDEYEFKTVPFTIPCCKLHFYYPKLLHIKLQFSKRNKQTPLLPLPEINSIYHAESAGSRDQPRPGSYLKKREEPGNEVGKTLVQAGDVSPRFWEITIGTYGSREGKCGVRVENNTRSVNKARQRTIIP